MQIKRKNSTLAYIKTELKNPTKMFELPPLPYTYDALEPYIDATTVEIHHDRHHGTYTGALNVAIKGTPLEGKSIIEIFDEIENYPAAVRNNGGGYANHNLYWQILAPKGTSERPVGEIASIIDSTYGSYEIFRDKFSDAAMGVFGSGWVWLVVKPDCSLEICSTALQDNPMMLLGGSRKGYPILGLDLWEHAYYLSYQNRRVEYIKNFFHIINWYIVDSLYHDALLYYGCDNDSTNAPLGKEPQQDMEKE